MMANLIRTWESRASKAGAKVKVTTNEFTIERLLTEVDIYTICAEELQQIVTEIDKQDTT